jgi:hypothetical protein
MAHKWEKNIEMIKEINYWLIYATYEHRLWSPLLY